MKEIELRQKRENIFSEVKIGDSRQKYGLDTFFPQSQARQNQRAKRRRGMRAKLVDSHARFKTRFLRLFEGLVHTDTDRFENANISLRIGLPVHTYPMNTDIKNATF